MTRESLALALLVALLTGCSSHYWSKPSGTLAQFTADHRECLEKGTPIPDRPGYVMIEQGTFRTCLAVRGWRREKHLREDVPPGRFRGVENLDLVPVAVDTLPKQPEWQEVSSYCGRLGPNATPEQRARCRR
jgi:hypothetical protein